MNSRSIDTKKLAQQIQKLFPKIAGDRDKIEIKTDYRGTYLYTLTQSQLQSDSTTKQFIELYMPNRSTSFEPLDGLLKTNGLIENKDFIIRIDLRGSTTQYFFTPASFDTFVKAISTYKLLLGAFILEHVKGMQAFDQGLYTDIYSEINFLNEANVEYNPDGSILLKFPDELIKKYILFYIKPVPQIINQDNIDFVKSVLNKELSYLFNKFNETLTQKFKPTIVFHPSDSSYEFGDGVRIKAEDVTKLEQLGFLLSTIKLKEQLWFINTVKQFKKEKDIKSLRREVFGVSQHEEVMKKILENRKKFFAIPYIAEFLTRPELIDDQSSLNLEHAFSLKEARKYGAIIFGSISHDQLKNPTKYQHTLALYDSNSDQQKTDLNTPWYQEKLRRHNQIPALAQLSVFNGQLTRHQFAYKNDIRLFIPWVNEAVIKTSLPDHCYFDGLIYYPDNLKDIFNKQYPGKEFAIFYYTHAHVNGTATGQHTSVLFCKVDNQGFLIKKPVINMDGYNKPDAFDPLGIQFQQNKQPWITHRFVICDEKNNPLQIASNYDFNCPVYAANIINAILSILSDDKKSKKLKSSMSQFLQYHENYEQLKLISKHSDIDLASQMIGLVRETLAQSGIYFDTNQNKLSEEIISAYHRDIRLAVARSYLKDQDRMDREIQHLSKPATLC